MTTPKNRRNFIKNTAAASAFSFVPFSVLKSMPQAKKRKFKMGLNPGAIGVNLHQEQLLEKASEYGFESIVAYSGTLAEWSDAQIDELTSAFIPYEKGDFGSAYKAIVSLQKIHPDKPDLAFYAAISKLGQGDAEVAIPMLQSCLQIQYQGVDEMAPWYLGLAYVKTGKVAEARKYLRQVPEGSRFAQPAEELLAEL